MNMRKKVSRDVQISAWSCESSTTVALSTTCARACFFHPKPAAKSKVKAVRIY